MKSGAIFVKNKLFFSILILNSTVVFFEQVASLRDGSHVIKLRVICHSDAGGLER
jgi:hypothetical protein